MTLAITRASSMGKAASSRPLLLSQSNAAFMVSQRTFASSSRINDGATAESSSRSVAPRSTSAPRRSSRFTARPGADLVGPPDPLSNLRPIRYGSAFEETSAADGSASTASGSLMSLTHPYSLNEFTSTSSNTSPSASIAWARSSDSEGRGRRQRIHSPYFERLLEKLEEAELAHKLRMARADNFNQRFWQDNNARFIQALSEFRSRTASSKAVATLRSPSTQANPADTTSSSATAKSVNQQESELDLDSDSLATFYSAWLKANAARHRAYNRQLWAQTFGDLAPAARYQCLRAWAKFVGALERRLGRS